MTSLLTYFQLSTPARGNSPGVDEQDRGRFRHLGDSAEISLLSRSPTSPAYRRFAGVGDHPSWPATAGSTQRHGSASFTKATLAGTGVPPGLV